MWRGLLSTKTLMGGWAGPTVVADIALLKLATDFPNQPTMPYTTGPGAGAGTAGVSAGTPATIIGWGADGYSNITDEATSFPTIPSGGRYNHYLQPGLCRRQCSCLRHQRDPHLCPGAGSRYLRCRQR